MKYKVIQRRGQGGFGVVDEVVDSNDKPFAMKTFSVSPLLGGDPQMEDIAKKRFIKEAKYQGEIKHRNVVPVLKQYLDHNPPYIIMPLGEASLSKDQQNGIIDRSNFMPALLDIMAGLEEIHSLGIFHRDLKPANIIRFQSNDKSKRDFYAISDFGLMSLKETSVTTLTATGSVRNSDFYTAPEITTDLKNASAQSDIYSLGCLLHDLIYVNPHRIPCGEINEISEYGDILRGCTRTDLNRRFKSVASVRDALASIEIVTATATSELGVILSEKLEDPTLLDPKTILEIVNFINSTKNKNETNAILQKIKFPHIEKLTGYGDLFRQFVNIYSTWVRNSSFNFENCDAYCNRLEKMIEDKDVDIQAEGLMALLYMGTDHNRYYVEKRFTSLLDSANDKVQKRVAMEIRVDEKKAVRAIDHLSRSIGYSPERLPEVIKKAYEQSKK